MENKIKHLEFIQTIILRMANNSFLIKGWTITIMAAMFALAAKDANKLFLILAYFPTIMFWMLDSYYLSQERHFRYIYNEVRVKNESDIDFSINSEAIKWSINLWAKATISSTIITFYGTIIILLLIIMWII